MISGFAIARYGERYRIAYQVEPGVQCAFRQDGDEAWLWSKYSQSSAAKTMKEIEMAVGVGALEGFTLFHHPGKGWQMSTRRVGEQGWSVQQGLDDAQVRSIFDLLEPVDHPSGPLTIVAPSAGLFEGLTAAILARIAG